MLNRSTRSTSSLRSRPGGPRGVEAQLRQHGRARSSRTCGDGCRPAGSRAGLPRDTVRARMLLYPREMNRFPGLDGCLRRGQPSDTVEHTVFRCVDTRQRWVSCVGAADLKPEASSPQKQSPAEARYRKPSVSPYIRPFPMGPGKSTASPWDTFLGH